MGIGHGAGARQQQAVVGLGRTAGPDFLAVDDEAVAILFAAQAINLGREYLAYLAAFAGDPEPEVTQKVIAGLDL